MTPRPTFNEWVKSIVDAYALRGTCSRRQAAAVGLDMYGRIVGIGMNGVPRGFPHCIQEGCECPGASDPPGQTENCYAIHAEQNMILNSTSPYDITQVYVSCSPCKSCALLLANLPGLLDVFYWEEYPDQRGVQILRRRRVETTLLPVQAPSL